MKTSLSPLLQKLNEDYQKNAGKPFEHFFCPILHLDEDVELCKGHILNRSLKGVNRTITVQRKDVDGFFGTMFEDDARNIEIYHQKQLHEIVFDSFLSKRFNSRIYAQGEVVDTFFSSGPFPDHATPIVFTEEQIAVVANSGKHSSLMALKMEAEKVRQLEGKQWEIEISLDVRLALAFTVLKAAHLTLFHIHGYHYALGAAGRFLGSVLGDFFKQNQGKKKPQVIEAAKTYLSPFVHMIRPLQAMGDGDTFFRGTLDDGLILLCRAGSGGYWGTIVLVNLGKTLHGVLLPVLDSASQAETFFGFLKNSNQNLHVHTCRFNASKQVWEVNPDALPLTWLKNESCQF